MEFCLFPDGSLLGTVKIELAGTRMARRGRHLNIKFGVPRGVDQVNGQPPMAPTATGSGSIAAATQRNIHRKADPTATGPEVAWRPTVRGSFGNLEQGPARRLERLLRALESPDKS